VRARHILHHSVNVHGGLDAAAAFYGGVLGLSIEPSRPVIPGIEGTWFRIGGSEIHLVDADLGNDAIRPTDVHVCLAVDDIDGAIRELDQANVPYRLASQGPVTQVFLADPSGNIIELQQDRSEAST